MTSTTPSGTTTRADRDAAPLPAVAPFWTAGHEEPVRDAAADPETDALLVLGVDRIERHYTRRPAMDDVGVFGSGPLSGRAPTGFDTFGPASAGDGLPTTVVLDALRWTSPESGDGWA